MAKVYTSSVVNAPAAKVWARVRDFNGLPSWHPAIGESRIHTSKNRVRDAINDVVIAIGGRNPSLRTRATESARRIGKVEVDHGDTACKTPDAAAYIDAFPIERVGEMHLAGFAEDCDGSGAKLLIDDHGRPVSETVWMLYRRVLARGCLTPTLVEWDNNVPAYPVLAAEAARARAALTAQAAQFEDREAA